MPEMIAADVTTGKKRGNTSIGQCVCLCCDDFFFLSYLSLSLGTQPFLASSRDPKIDTDRLPVPKCMGVWVWQPVGL